MKEDKKNKRRITVKAKKIQKREIKAKSVAGKKYWQKGEREKYGSEPEYRPGELKMLACLQCYGSGLFWTGSGSELLRWALWNRIWLRIPNRLHRIGTSKFS